MKDVMIQVNEMLDQGMRPLTIAGFLGIPIEWVYNEWEARSGPEFNYCEEEQYHAEHQ